MNPQPDPFIGVVCAIIFVVMVVIFTIQAYHKKDNLFTDKYIIGYIDDYQIPVVNTLSVNTKKVESSKQSKSKFKSPKIPKAKKIKPIKPKYDEQLYNDCINCLVALGYKKLEAKNKTKQIFEHNKITSITQFINIATKL